MKNYKIKILAFLFIGFGIINFKCDKFKDIESGSPEQIVIKAAQFYNEKNPDNFLRLLSSSAIKKMDHSLEALRHQFKTLDVQYRQDLAEKMNMAPNSLIDLKMTDYIKFNMNLNSSGMGSDNVLFPVSHIVDTEYIGVEVNDLKSVVKYKEATIHLVKEKKFWKINTFEILHKKSDTKEDFGE
ncbi:MAG: hypothetical protein OEV78_07775 [Spirochaetia bacterium]|nr:hypothetical protein [Spirochaetia bacterium]